MPSKNSKYVVIVESPAKAKTIERYLGKDYEVIASKGHVRDLPPKKFGIDLKNNFEPEFEIMTGKDKVISSIKKTVKGKKVYLAADMDREGEAIAWHLSEILKLKKDEENRIIFTEITKNAINKAIKEPLKIDFKKVDAQLARRMLDRIVGYKISPLLWKVFKSGNTSAGRVQSATLKILIDKERKIFKFKPKTYFKLSIQHNELKIPLVKENGKKLNAEKIDLEKKNEILEYLKDKEYFVKSVKNREAKRNPPMPFITSTLQQSAINMLGWSSKKAMKVAQGLYEGIETKEGHVAFITYMRTDSTRISDVAMKAATEHITKNYGKEFAGIYKSKKTKSKVQDAHEAIRPTNIEMTPQAAKAYLSGDNLRLYTLIWNRFMASQSTTSKYDETTYNIFDSSERFEFQVSAKKRKFKGFEIFWKSSETEKKINLNKSGKVDPAKLNAEEAQTKPPARFSEASLVKELESNGIGRPSTYATIISTLITRNYIKRLEKNILIPTLTGFVVNDFLEKTFPNIIDSKFTASMESELDMVEHGEETSKQLLGEFYKDFEPTLKEINKKIKNAELNLNYKSDIKCEECNKEMNLMFGRYGMYLKCPKCEKSKKLPPYILGVTIKDKVYINEEIPALASPEAQKTGEKCPKCGADLVLKTGRFGQFIACSNYPECKFTKSVPARGKCPECGGEVAKLKSKKGKLYYKCTECSSMFWNEPSNFKCKSCGKPLFYVYKNKKEMLFCPEEKQYFDIEEYKE